MGSFKGSVPVVAEGYEFVGWYLDPDGTVEPVSELAVYITLTADENGSDSVTVRDLPCCDYTVEQVGSWSWR